MGCKQEYYDYNDYNQKILILVATNNGTITNSNKMLTNNNGTIIITITINNGTITLTSKNDIIYNQQ